VQDVCWSTDSKRLLTAGGDRVLKVFNATNGAELTTLKGHKGEVFSGRFSHDGQYVVSGGEFLPLLLVRSRYLTFHSFFKQKKVMTISFAFSNCNLSRSWAFFLVINLGSLPLHSAPIAGESCRARVMV
jgi:WD40 repeat protein